MRIIIFFLSGTYNNLVNHLLVIILIYSFANKC